MASDAVTSHPLDGKHNSGPGVLKSLLHLGAYIILQIIGGGVFLAIGIGAGLVPADFKALMNNPSSVVVCVLLGAASAAVFMGLWQKTTIKNAWRYRPSPEKKYPLLFTVALAGSSFAFVGIYNFLLQPPMQPEYQVFGDIIQDGGWKMFVILLSIVVAAPFVEELLFRAQLLPAVTRLAAQKFDAPTSAFIGIMASSAVFALIHMQFYAAPAQFVFGAALAIIYTRHKSLAEVTFVHMFVNLIGVLTITG